jgi:Domain of unknown function (DUF4865)
MLAKQYTIKLPADYDMEIIRRRVRDRGDAFDAFPGLVFKAFLITERVRGATANRYAPFYLWHDITGTNEFLFGDGFTALQASFGRPLIEHWIPLEITTPAAGTDSQPCSATREDIIISGDDELAVVRDRERDWLRRRSSDPGGLDAAVVALDPYRWQLVRFALWRAPLNELDPIPHATSYELLHLSRPDPSSSSAIGKTPIGA